LVASVKKGENFEKLLGQELDIFGDYPPIKLEKVCDKEEGTVLRLIFPDNLDKSFFNN
jgi:hypothetical protein